jgi:hypothetical protein
MKALAVIWAVVAIVGCHDVGRPVASRLAAEITADSSATLSVARGDTFTVYHLTVRGFGDYDRASGWFVTGMIADSLLHGVYAGEGVPDSHDYLWLSDPATSAFEALVWVSVSRGSTNFMTISIPFQVVSAGHAYTIRLWRIDANGERAGVFQSFGGSAI